MVSKNVKGSRLRNTIGSMKILGRVGQGRGGLQELSISDVIATIKGSGGAGGVIPHQQTIGTFRAVGGTPGRKPLDGEELFAILMKAGDSFPTNLAGSLLACEVAPTADWTITFTNNALTVGSGKILASASTGTYTLASGITFAEGDLFVAKAISPQDASLSGVSYSLLGNRLI